jgi:hypothetical protein
MKILKRIAALLGMALGAGAVWLAFSFERAFSGAPGVFRWGTWRDYVSVAVMASLGLAVIVVAYCFGFCWHAEPTASPNGGPAHDLSDSGVNGGPPSVS